MNNGKMQFDAVVRFEMPVEEAAGILSEPEELAGASLVNWFNAHGCAEERRSTYNLQKLRAGLGEYLAERKIEERRMLVQCTDAVERDSALQPSVPPF